VTRAQFFTIPFATGLVATKNSDIPEWLTFRGEGSPGGKESTVGDRITVRTVLISAVNHTSRWISTVDGVSACVYSEDWPMVLETLNVLGIGPE
jgi:hypothetical protein